MQKGEAVATVRVSCHLNSCKRVKFMTDVWCELGFVWVHFVNRVPADYIE